MKLSSLQKGLVGHWTMAQDSLKGSLLADKTPYENDGTIKGATFTTDRKGKANSAMSFNGTGDYIHCGNNASFNFTTITTSVWVKTTSAGDIGTFFSKDGYFILRKQTNNTAQFTVFKSPSDWQHSNYSTYNINDGLWHHIVGTYDGNYIKLYVDGEEQGSPVLYSGTLRIVTTAVLIGSRTVAASQPFNGSIDDVRIYNRALSEPEIKTLYNSYNPKIIL